MAKSLSVNRERRKNVYRQLSNLEANISHDQMSPMSLIENSTTDWGQVMLFINDHYNISQSYTYIQVL